MDNGPFLKNDDGIGDGYGVMDVVRHDQSGGTRIFSDRINRGTYFFSFDRVQIGEGFIH